jgi:hypothetical protein
MVNDTPERVEREPRDWRTEEEARIDTRSRLSDRDLRFLFELVSTEAWRGCSIGSRDEHFDVALHKGVFDPTP